MYKQFCKNLMNFIQVNSMEKGDNIRVEIAKQLLPLAQLESFLTAKEKNDAHYRATVEMIHRISLYSEQYPSIKKFIRELWAYGFDITPQAPYNSPPDPWIRDKAKLVDLLLRSHYF